MTRASVEATVAELVEVALFCAQQAEIAAKDKAARRWLAVGLVIALQGACLCALSGYETADETDVMDLKSARALDAWRASGGAQWSKPEARLAPVQLLVRRVRSPDYLNDPERLAGFSGRAKAIDRLVELRNAAVHVGGRPPEMDEGDFAEAALAACDAVRRLVVEHPAFDTTGLGAQVAMIAESLARLRAALSPAAARVTQS